MSESGAHQRRHVLFDGVVQGVGFRYTTRRVASRLPVTGYVRNLSDGRVEMVVEGLPEDLDRLMGTIQDEMEGYIKDTQVSGHPATGQFRQFDIRF